MNSRILEILNYYEDTDPELAKMAKAEHAALLAVVNTPCNLSMFTPEHPRQVIQNGSASCVDTDTQTKIKFSIIQFVL